MLCPLCHQRKARRACPAVGQQICPVCCGTKRLVEIQCPSDCPYLATAREHPAAAVVRQQQHDLGWLIGHMRDLGERQSQLFFLLCSFLSRYGIGQTDPAGYASPDLHAPADEDVIDAAGALAATLETSARGVIYEHRPASIPAERLIAALKPLLNEVGKNGGTAFERDASVVLRRIEQAAREIAPESNGNRRAFLELLRRVMRKPAEDRPGAAAEGGGAPAAERSRLILP